EGRGLKGLAGSLPRQLLRGQLAQLAVDQRQELLGGVLLALLDGRQDACDLVHEGEDNPPRQGRQGNDLTGRGVQEVGDALAIRGTGGAIIRARRASKGCASLAGAAGSSRYRQAALNTCRRSRRRPRASSPPWASRRPARRWSRAASP